MRNALRTLLPLLLCLCALLSACALESYLPLEPDIPIGTDAPDETDAPIGTDAPVGTDAPAGTDAPDEPFSLEQVPAYAGEPYAAVHGNVPYFTPEECVPEAFETYDPLDALGRCGVCVACVGTELMPTEDRGSISAVKPTGWQSVEYDCVDGKHLYNRCHLIGFQLTGENANERNLITGTRYLNVDGMLPFENLVADYVKETGNHVLYRATPVFTGANLVADGVLLEGLSVEDAGDGVCFCVFCYNVQPGVEIDLATGESREAPVPAAESGGEAQHYVLNTNTMRFHRPDCTGADRISEENRAEFTGTREELLAMGYTPCGNCEP